MACRAYMCHKSCRPTLFTFHVFKRGTTRRGIKIFLPWLFQCSSSHGPQNPSSPKIELILSAWGPSIEDVGIFQGGEGGSQSSMLQDIRRQGLGKSGLKFQHGGYHKWPKKILRLLWTTPCEAQWVLLLKQIKVRKSQKRFSSFCGRNANKVICF